MLYLVTTTMGTPFIIEAESKGQATRLAIMVSDSEGYEFDVTNYPPIRIEGEITQSEGMQLYETAG